VNTVKVKVYEKDDFYEVPSNAKEFILFFQEKIDLIPDQFKDSAFIEIDSRTYCDSSYINIDIHYFRPKTEEELQLDAENSARQQEQAKRRKLAEFERLKRELDL
jgi:hypothetical protein